MISDTELRTVIRAATRAPSSHNTQPWIHTFDDDSILEGTLSVTTDARPTSDVGSYTITAAGLGTDNGNYAITYLDGALSVDPASLTVTVNDTTRTYGGTNPTDDSGVFVYCRIEWPGYRFQLKSRTGLAGTAVHAGFHLEAGGTWQDRHEVAVANLRAGGAVVLGLDTLLGPIRFAYGLTDGGHDAVHLVIGHLR